MRPGMVAADFGVKRPSIVTERRNAEAPPETAVRRGVAPTDILLLKVLP
jgi:hypothetical protein